MCDNYSEAHKQTVCTTFSAIRTYLYYMKKTKKLIVRITENQFKKVADALITEERNKSAFVRNALDCYIDKRYTEINAEKNEDNKSEV